MVHTQRFTYDAYQIGQGYGDTYFIFLVTIVVPICVIMFNADDNKELLTVEQDMVKAFNNRNINPAEYCTPDTVLLTMRKEIMGGHEGSFKLKYMRYNIM